MAGELKGRDTGNPGGTHKFRLRDALSRVWHVVNAAWEVWSDANFAAYGITATRLGTTTSFAGDLPTAAGAEAASAELWDDTGTLSTSVVTSEQDLRETASASQVATAVETTLTAAHGSGSWTNRPIGGAYTYTVTATSNGTTPLAGIVVRLTGGTYSDAFTTGIDGLAVFTVAAGTYTLSAAAGNGAYVYTASTETIAGTAAKTITLTARSIPTPTDPSQTTAYTTCRDGTGAPVVGAKIYFRLLAAPGVIDSYDRYNFVATSGGGGLLTQPLTKGTTMEARRGDKGVWKQFPVGTADTFELPQTLGGQGS